MNKLNVSVIIPTFNSGRLLAEAIESVLSQSLPPAEIIVIDDGSTDDTRERLRPYAEAVRHLEQDNKGVSAARNRGVSEARGELIAFLDADDVWHPRKLELQVRAIAEDDGLGLLGTRAFDWPAAYPDLDGDDLHQVLPVTWRQLVVKNYLTTSSVVARRKLLIQAGPFDTGIQGPEDRDLWLRVAQISRIANLDSPLTGYRSVPGSVSKRSATCQAGMLRILGKLDERKAWEGSPTLRNKAYSYAYHSCAYLYDSENHRTAAFFNMLKSFAWYPFPFRRGEVRTRLERPKRLAVIAMKALGLRRRESTGKVLPDAYIRNAVETASL